MLLEEFSTIFDRPEKVKKLREYILQLAVRGKLVPQDERDEPASILLEKIREERGRLVKGKKIKKEKPLPEISEDEIPYDLPKGWEWVRLGEVCKLYNGYAFKSKDYIEKGIPIIRISDVFSEITDLSNCIRVRDELYDERYIIRKGDFLIAMSGGTTGKYGIYNCDTIALQNQRVGNIKTIYSELVYDNYKNYFIIANRSKILKLAYGGAQPNISNAIIENLEFSLPPLNEQKRIVEKIDYLMKFCDKLEEQLEKKVKYGSLSAKAVLNGVSNCSTFEELEESLRFIIENFKDLTLTDGAVVELKNAILSLAVKGKLVQQDENDEPASILLNRIRADKDRLVKEKKIKKEKELPEISVDEIPYELPKGWQWARLGNLSSIIEYGTSTKAHLDLSKVPVLRMNNIYEGKILYKNLKYVDYDIKDLPRLYLKHGELLFNRTNSYELVGKTAVFDKEDDKYTFASYLIRIRLFNDYLDSKYINYMMNSSVYRIYQIEPQITQQNGQANFNGTKLKSTLIAIPPLNEQKRIVEKVDRLMKICDELQLRIEKSKKYSEQLMESILKDSFKA